MEWRRIALMVLVAAAIIVPLGSRLLPDAVGEPGFDIAGLSSEPRGDAQH